MPCIITEFLNFYRSYLSKSSMGIVDFLKIYSLHDYLTFKRHITLLNSKLKRTNSLIALSRHYLPKKLMMEIYYGQFYSHLNYGCQLWGQNENAITQTITLQKKAVRLLSFSHFQEHASPLFKNLKLLKLTDIVKQNNMIFTHNTLNGKNYFVFNKTNHNIRL